MKKQLKAFSVPILLRIALIIVTLWTKALLQQFVIKNGEVDKQQKAVQLKNFADFYQQLLLEVIVRKRARRLQMVWKSCQQTRKSWFWFTVTPNINLLNPKSILSVPKTFISDDKIDTFVQFTNDYADIIIKTSKI